MDHLIMQPHPLTCISSGDGEHCSNILLIMLEKITQCLSNGGWCSSINPDMLMLLHEGYRKKIFFKSLGPVNMDAGLSYQINQAFLGKGKFMPYTMYNCK